MSRTSDLLRSLATTLPGIEKYAIEIVSNAAAEMDRLQKERDDWRKLVNNAERDEIAGLHKKIEQLEAEVKQLQAALDWQRCVVELRAASSPPWPAWTEWITREYRRLSEEIGG